ncbi:MAG: DUF2794 domain-containing protein [Pelagibacteraceae bacterium]
MKNLRLIINNDIKRKSKDIFFVKTELQTILNLYARMVSNGTWKDYGLSSGSKEISFDVYQRSSDKPVIRILKNLKPSNFSDRFLIKDNNGKIIERSENLNRLIKKTSWGNLKISN